MLAQYSENGAGEFRLYYRAGDRNCAEHRAGLGRRSGGLQTQGLVQVQVAAMAFPSLMPLGVALGTSTCDRPRSPTSLHVCRAFTGISLPRAPTPVSVLS